MTAIAKVIDRLSLLDGPVFVGLSGGADSALLAHCAVEAGLAPTLVFVHHGLSGSDQMQEAANKVAQHLKLPLQVLETTMSGTSETEARSVRYAAFDTLSTGSLLLGHSLSDQAETVLLHLLRGSGPRGLAGIPAARGRVLRPLLELSRSQIRGLVSKLGIPFRDDPENDDPTHLRNWVRSAVIPVLEERVPQTQPLLARTAQLMADVTVAGITPTLSWGSAVLPLAQLRVATIAELTESLREAVRLVRAPYPASFDEVGRLAELVDGSSPRVELEGGLIAVRDRAVLRIGPVPSVPTPATIEDERIWGQWKFSDGSGRVGTSLASRVPVGSIVRGARSGDQISMGNGSKEVWQALSEQGVPKDLRPAWPVVESKGVIVWVPGVRNLPKTELPQDGYLDLDASEESS